MKTKMIEFLDGKTGLTGLVLGVGAGHDIPEINKGLDIDMLYLVDFYKPFVLKGSLNDSYVSKYDNAKELMDIYSDKITFIKKDATKCFDEIPNDLDFIWVDICYDYDTISDIFNKYFPKVKKGGIFAGNRFTLHFPDFKKALINFCSFNHILLNTIVDFEDKNNGEWWVIKDE